MHKIKRFFLGLFYEHKAQENRTQQTEIIVKQSEITISEAIKLLRSYRASGKAISRRRFTSSV